MDRQQPAWPKSGRDSLPPPRDRWSRILFIALFILVGGLAGGGFAGWSAAMPKRGAAARKRAMERTAQETGEHVKQRALICLIAGSVAGLLLGAKIWSEPDKHD